MRVGEGEQERLEAERLRWDWGGLKSESNGDRSRAGFAAEDKGKRERGKSEREVLEKTAMSKTMSGEGRRMEFSARKYPGLLRAQLQVTAATHKPPDSETCKRFS